MRREKKSISVDGVVDINFKSIYCTFHVFHLLSFELLVFISTVHKTKIRLKNWLLIAAAYETRVYKINLS